jgi:hypothetical protein
MPRYHTIRKYAASSSLQAISGELVLILQCPRPKPKKPRMSQALFSIKSDSIESRFAILPTIIPALFQPLDHVSTTKLCLGNWTDKI